MINFKEKLNRISTFIFDVDGVLTDGKVYMLPGQEPMRALNTKDGFAMQLAIKKGYKIAIITGGKSIAITEALTRLGCQFIYTGQSDKLACYKDFINETGIPEEQILFMGDDLPDWEVMKRTGIAACPFDSAEEIKAISIYVSRCLGGQGCARDVIEQVLRVRGDWEITGW